MTWTPKICAVMSVPRVGFNSFWGGAHSALLSLGIDVWTIESPFYGQSMQRAFESVAGGSKFDWLLTIDYDTMFTSEHVRGLISTLQTEQGVDALAPLQARRTWGTPLGLPSAQASDLLPKSGLIRVDTAHFGLTLLRLDRLRKLSRPWFWSHPDSDGCWIGHDKVDDDTYFWNHWLAAGFNVFIHPGVRVGHLEIMVRDFGEDLSERLLAVEHWRREHGAVPGAEVSHGA